MEDDRDDDMDDDMAYCDDDDDDCCCYMDVDMKMIIWLTHLCLCPYQLLLVHSTTD